MKIKLSINNEDNPVGIDPLLFIAHHTGSSAPDENQEKFLNKNDYISVHYGLNRRGQIVQLMDLDRIAFHCGVSAWKGMGIQKLCVNPKTGEKYYISGINPIAHGVEIYSDGKSFTRSQFKSFIKLAAYWCIKFDRKAEHVIRHADIAPERKWDVGPDFYKEYGEWSDVQKIIEKRIRIIKENFAGIQESKEFIYV